ncbi:MAG: hypothetical protein WKG01_19465 [Kofleriaceae bacterium]
MNWPAQTHGLAAVAARELAPHRKKTEQTSNWTRRPLSPEQVAYPAADVEVLIGLEPLLRTGVPLFARKDESA